jgi:hypothetical protein
MLKMLNMMIESSSKQWRGGGHSDRSGRKAIQQAVRTALIAGASLGVFGLPAQAQVVLGTITVTATPGGGGGLGGAGGGQFTVSWNTDTQS